MYLTPICSCSADFEASAIVKHRASMPNRAVIGLLNIVMGTYGFYHEGDDHILREGEWGNGATRQVPHAT